MNNLRRFDLNLLVVLEALLIERHLTRAAQRLSMSQPAVSHALKRLRQQLEDELFVRSAGGLQPTRKALALADPLYEVLDGVRTLTGRRTTFNPAAETRLFRIALSDYGVSLILPGVLQKMRRLAPDCRLLCLPAAHGAIPSQLSNGDIDLALCVNPAPNPSLRSAPLFTERWLCMADARAGKADRLTDWLNRPHLLISADGEDQSSLDALLARQGKRRHIAAVVPHYTAATRLLAGTDLILTLPARLAHNPAASLIAFAPPLPLEEFDYGLIWHARSDGDEGHRWLRDLFSER
ncbi:LysR family transcriptional regulator [Affinibrenneria salicis]|uniref:LysR family transcriptional regulator n=1 Tax=Affinibrenneria salicis TaxID=2590031 RepID=A0A5J5FY91_9GAMM|nr:LysR family transcriptional regulator [Affinibrenneria salicis]KAA8998847.1 LysR family transcriptional regulator [Affinibrenneria salicis]